MAIRQPHGAMTQTCYRNNTLCMNTEYDIIVREPFYSPIYVPISTKCTNGESADNYRVLSTLQSDEAAWIVAYLAPLQTLAVSCSSLLRTLGSSVNILNILNIPFSLASGFSLLSCFCCSLPPLYSLCSASSPMRPRSPQCLRISGSRQ